MHRRISWLCLLLVLMMNAAAFAEVFQTKPKLAFYPLAAKSVDAIPFTEKISTQLFNNIEGTKFFEILERKRVESVLVQDGLTPASLSQADLHSVANMAGFDFFVVGHVSRLENASLIELQIAGSSSRSSYYAETFHVSEFEIQKRLLEISEKIVATVKGFLQRPDIVETEIGPPVDLAISGTPKSIKLKWPPLESPQVIGYAIMRAKSADGSFVQLATTTSPGYTDKNLNLNETFYYKVKAISKNGVECRLSETITGRTSLAPLPPIFIDIKPELAGAQLNWYNRPYSGSDKNLMTSGFQIYRKAPNHADYSMIAKVGPDVASYLDKGMKHGTVYSYAITSFNPENVESDFSSVLEARNASAVSNIKASSGGKRKVQLSWMPNASKSIEGYTIYRAAPGDQDFRKIAHVKDRNASSYLDSGLDDGSSYRYCISASIEGKGESPKSDPVSATTRQRPPTPTTLVASSNEPRRVLLKWESTGTSEDDIKGYNLYRSLQEDGKFIKLAEIPYNGNSYIHFREMDAADKNRLSEPGSLAGDGTKQLSDGTTYYYRISCFNDLGSESLQSPTVSATTRNMLAAPRNLRATTNQAGRVTINWEGSPEFSEYEVYRGATGQNEVIMLKSVKEPFFEDGPVPDGTSYIYAIKGIDAYQIPSYISTSVIGSTKARPAIPGGIVATEKDGKPGIQWEPNPEKDVLRYIVYKKNFVGLFQKVKAVYGTFYMLDDVEGKQELRVAAEDADGLESDQSDVLVVESK